MSEAWTRKTGLEVGLEGHENFTIWEWVRGLFQVQRYCGEEVALELERREKNDLGGEAEESHGSGGYTEFGVHF